MTYFCHSYNMFLWKQRKCSIWNNTITENSLLEETEGWRCYSEGRAALAKDTILNPSTTQLLVTICNSRFRDPMPSLGLHGLHACTQCIDMHAGKTLTQNNRKSSIKKETQTIAPRAFGRMWSGLTRDGIKEEHENNARFISCDLLEHTFENTHYYWYWGKSSVLYVMCWLLFNSHIATAHASIYSKGIISDSMLHES